MTRRSIFVFVLLFASFSTSVFAEKGPKPPLKTIIIDPGHGGKDGGAQGAVSREAILALEIGLKLRNMMKAEMPDLNVLMTRESDDLPGGLSDRNAANRWRAEYANQNNGDLFISIHLNASLGNQRYGKKAVGTRQETYYVYSGKGKKRKKIAKTRTVTKYERYKLPATVLGTQTYILANDWYQKKVSAVGKKSDLYEAGEPSDSTADLFLVDPVQARIMAQQYTKYYFQKSLTLATYCEEEFAQQGRYSWGVQQRDWEGIWVLQATQMPSILVETGFVDNANEEQYLASDKGQEEVARAILNAIKRYKQMLENPSKEPLKAKATPASVPASDQLAKEGTN